MEAISKLSSRGGQKIHPASAASAQREYEKLTQIGGFFIAYGLDSCSDHLKRFDDSPFILSCLGHMHLLKKPSLSIIGARNTLLNSCKYAERISRELGEQGYVVISGMARGIDRSAHQGALISVTIAVLENGIDIPYPLQNRDIYQTIKQSGLYYLRCLLAKTQRPFFFLIEIV